MAVCQHTHEARPLMVDHTIPGELERLGGYVDESDGSELEEEEAPLHFSRKATKVQRFWGAIGGVLKLFPSR